MSFSRLSRLRNISGGSSITYRGRRRDSYAPLDRAELVELRARMRTYDQAYQRTALTNLGYSVVILKLFDRRFHRIGLLFALLAGILFFLAFLRRRRSNHDFADGWSDTTDVPVGRRIFGRPFRTAGDIVLAISVIIILMNIALLGLLFEL